MSFKFFSDLYDLISTARERRRYEKIKENPEESAVSTRFGKRFVANAVSAIVLSLIALALSVTAGAMRRKMDTPDLAIGFEFILYIVLFACAVILVFYAIVLYLSRLKYIRWQRSLNDLPIGKTARIMAIITAVVLAAVSITAVVLLILSLA